MDATNKEEQKLNNTNKKHSCKVCEKSFLTNSQLIRHERIHTGERPYACDFCEKTFRQSSTLASHKRLHTGEKPYSCEICEEAFTNRSSILNHNKSAAHSKRIDSINPNNFVDCGEAIKVETIKEEIIEGEDDAPLSIQQDKGNIKRIKSKSTNLSFTQNNLVDCKKIATREKPYSCDVCEKLFAQKSNLTSHKRVHTGERPYECNICEKAFFYSSHLADHKRIHTGVKQHACKFCKKMFYSKSDLTKHTRAHTGEKPYSCDVCQKSYAQSSTLSVHNKTAKHIKRMKWKNTDLYHKQKSFVDCDKTNKTEDFKEEIMEEEGVDDPILINYNTESFVKEEIKEEVEELDEDKNLFCKDCRQTFRNKYTLHVHKRIHTGEKPYSCDVCEKSFHQNSYLTKHKITHTGEKQHVCKICNKKFYTNSDLTKHTRVHTGEKPYSCDICQKSYSQSSLLSVHKNTAAHIKRIKSKKEKSAEDPLSNDYHIESSVKQKIKEEVPESD